MKALILTLLLPALSALAQTESPAVHVEMIARPDGVGDTWTLRGINGRKLLCPGADTLTESCTVNRVLPPQDCDWECQDGVLSGQGRSVFRGRFSTTGSDSSFSIDAAWDIWRNTEIRGPLYRISKAERGYVLTQVERQKKAKTFASLDFSRSDDVNFQLDPTRADDMLNGTEGLLVTGQLQNKSFRVDQVWRQWSPRLTCDVWAIAKARAFVDDPMTVNMIFGTEAEATSFQDPAGRSLRWLTWEREDADTVVFRSGINDLWSEVFAVANRGCAVTVLAEH